MCTPTLGGPSLSYSKTRYIWLATEYRTQPADEDKVGWWHARTCNLVITFSWVLRGPRKFEANRHKIITNLAHMIKRWVPSLSNSFHQICKWKLISSIFPILGPALCCTQMYPLLMCKLRVPSLFWSRVWKSPSHHHPHHHHHHHLLSAHYVRSSWAIGSAQVHAAVDVGVVALRGGGGQVTDRHARRRRRRRQRTTADWDWDGVAHARCGCSMHSYSLTLTILNRPWTVLCTVRTTEACKCGHLRVKYNCTTLSFNLRTCENWPHAASK